MAHSRISITLPEEVLAAADRLAQALDRSRSWVVAEAIRLLDSESSSVAPRAVREAPPPPDGVSEVAEARRRHLVADLHRTAADRLRRSAELAQLARAGRRRGARTQIIGFDCYEDFYAWKKASRAGA